MEVRRGNAGGAFQTVYGMQIQWLYVVIYAAALFVAFLVALAIRWWQRRDDRMIARLLKHKRTRDQQ
jgi:hypothetical protein